MASSAELDPETRLTSVPMESGVVGGQIWHRARSGILGQRPIHVIRCHRIVQVGWKQISLDFNSIQVTRAPSVICFRVITEDHPILQDYDFALFHVRNRDHSAVLSQIKEERCLRGKKKKRGKYWAMTRDLWKSILLGIVTSTSLKKIKIREN